MGLLALTLMTYLFYVHWIFKKWNANVIGRRNKHSPSDHPLPPIKTLDDSKELILNNSKLHEQFDTWELLNDVRNMKVTRKKKNRVIREQAKRTYSTSGESNAETYGASAEVEAAEELDMDHV